MRRLIPACFLALAAFLCVGRAKGSSIIYSIGCCGGSPWNLYQVSAADGASTYIGPIEGVQLVGTLAAAPNGTLFASGESFFFDPELLTINSATATATLVTLLTGLPNDVGAYSFAFSRNGTLFATYGGELFTIDVNSGDATLVGQTPGGSLAFSSDGTLYSSNGGDLYTVNQSTGAASLVTTLAFDSGFGETGSPNQMSLAFDPADGTLYTLAEWAGVEQSWLGTIDIATGEVTPIGITGFVGPGGLAIEASPEPASGFLIPVGLFILVALRQSLAGRANPCDYEKLCALFPSPSSASRSQVSPPSRKRPPSPIPTP